MGPDDDLPMWFLFLLLAIAAIGALAFIFL